MMTSQKARLVDFFEKQEKARRDTRLLMFYFFVAVILVVVMTYFIVAPGIVGSRSRWVHRVGYFQTIIGNYFNSFFLLLTRPRELFQQLWDPLLFAQVAAVTTALIAAGSLWKMRQLASGGSAVAEILEARPLAPESNEQERIMRDVVEEMAVASGANAPQVFVLDDERGINAFAAGFAAEDMIIVVTRGALGLLNRDEMQAVVAHEFSHIVNGDTILKLRLTGWVHGILMLDTIGRRLMEQGNEARDEEAVTQVPLYLLGGIFRFFGAPGLPFCRLIKCAICREREWLADAAAVQFTRNPPGLTGALEKIGGLPKHGRLDNPHCETISHLFFASYTRDSWMPFLAAHPPLDKRILALDPTFDGKFAPVKMLPISRGEQERVLDQAIGAVLTAEKFGADDVDINAARLAAVLKSADNAPLNESNLLRAAAQTAEGATALSYTLLGCRANPDLANQLSAGFSHKVASYLNSLDDLKKLALVDMSLPALGRLKTDAYNVWAQNLNTIIGAEKDRTLFEYTAALIFSHVTPQNTTVRENVLYRDIDSVADHFAVLLSAIARETDNPEEAFDRGRNELENPGASVTLLDAASCDLRAVHASLERISYATPALKQNILWACAKAAHGHAEMQPNQVLLLRAMSETLRCKLPVFARFGGPAELRATSDGGKFAP
jgi:Zn-dependent protease with chaperone function